jgi:hypothetical protein
MQNMVISVRNSFVTNRNCRGLSVEVKE